MKIIIITILVILVILALAYLVIVASGPQKKDYAHLIKPRVIEKEDMTALVVDFDGDPSVVIKTAFGHLFKAYYSLKGAPKGKDQPHPMARYEGIDEILTSADDLKSVPWKGFTAIAIPGDSLLSSDGPVRIENVSYGKVAEIVHFGPYTTEKSTIEQLKTFITESGYEISGLHEEEYIIGPGLIYRSPKSYITIIRYQIK